ncbi:hypothetical protein [uncultured Microscilla sp.]|uniref:TPR end-of-group domain-containing protein n=1 Tax=uncultured Microscilla sp. TaxID=432653 RepID=UPI0026285913|nr:hypothetical protein [uncultured Microscilla sp.]
MTHQNYLEKNQEAIEQIKKLLESGEKHNIELAFQLIKGGGMVTELVTHLYALSIFYTDDDALKRRAKLYYKNIASVDLYEFTKYKWNVYGEYYNENKMTEFLTKLGAHPKLDHKILANMALLYAHKGAKYCLENETASPQKIIAQLVDQDMLDLDYLNLDTLPKEIGLFKQIKFLYLEGNNFTDIPDELAQLTQLQSLSYKNTPLTDEAFQKLETFFPKIFATQYYMEIIDDINQGINYENSLQVLDKVLQLDATYATAWNDKGRVLQESKQPEAALECYDQYLKYAEYDNDRALSRVNKALALQNLGWQEELTKTAQEAMDILKQIPVGSRDRVYYFSQGLALFFMNDYNNALKAYDQGLAHDQYDGVLWYNKACTYAKQGNQKAMFQHLERAIQLRERFRIEAKEDLDFKEYWADEGFLKIIKEA